VEFIEIIQKRRSIREYRNEPILPDLVARILNAANLAPSAGNLQAFDIYIVESLEKRRELAAAANGQDFIVASPISLVFCANPVRNQWRYKARGENLYSTQDATIACTYAMLAATELGIGTVWVGAFSDNAVLEVLGNPQGLKPVAILPLGYPVRVPDPKPRRSLDDLVHVIT
jgi:nitroreductase